MFSDFFDIQEYIPLSLIPTGGGGGGGGLILISKGYPPIRQLLGSTDSSRSFVRSQTKPPKPSIPMEADDGVLPTEADDSPASLASVDTLISWMSDMDFTEPPPAHILPSHSGPFYGPLGSVEYFDCVAKYKVLNNRCTFFASEHGRWGLLTNEVGEVLAVTKGTSADEQNIDVEDVIITIEAGGLKCRFSCYNLRMALLHESGMVHLHMLRFIAQNGKTPKENKELAFFKFLGNTKGTHQKQDSETTARNNAANTGNTARNNLMGVILGIRIML